MNLKLSSRSPLKSSGGAPAAWKVLPMDNTPSTKEAMCSGKDVSAEISASEAVLCACRLESNLSICVNLCRPEIAPFSVINVHVLENIGPFSSYTGGVCPFELGLFYAETSFVGDREPAWQNSGHSFDWRRRCKISSIISRYRHVGAFHYWQHKTSEGKEHNCSEVA